MSFTVSSYAEFAGLVLALSAVAGLGLALGLLLRRLWARGKGLRGREGLRVENAVQRYGFWLEWYDAPRRQRRGLRDDLRANLWESAQVVGAKEAVARLGSIRSLAREAARSDPGREGRPQWEAGVGAGILAAGAVIVGQMLLGLAWFDGAFRSGASKVTSSTPVFPGASITFTQDPGGFAWEASPGYLFVIAFVAVFVIASRPWRLVRSGR